MFCRNCLYFPSVLSKPLQRSLPCDAILLCLGDQGSWPCCAEGLSQSHKWILLIGLSFMLMLWVKCNHMSNVKNLPDTGGHKLVLQLVWLNHFRSHWAVGVYNQHCVWLPLVALPKRWGVAASMRHLFDVSPGRWHPHLWTHSKLHAARESSVLHTSPVPMCLPLKKAFCFWEWDTLVH